MSFTQSFEHFTQELGQKLKVARETGMGERTVVERATEVGDWLAKNYDPKNPEQRLLKEIWEVSDRNEQQAIASAVVKMVEKHYH